MGFRADIVRVPLLQRPRAFLDIETTGLKFGWNEVTEICIDHEKLGLWSCRVKPRHMKRAHPDALEMQNFNPTDWEDAPYFEDVAAKVIEYTENTILIGHNVAGFDVPFLHGQFEMVELTSRGISRALVDTTTLAIEHLVPKGLKSLKLGSICDHLKISNEDAHTAMSDVTRVKAVYDKIIGDQLKLF